jgi:hypothetical protein
MGSGTMIYIPSYIKVGAGIQNLRGIHTDIQITRLLFILSE